MSQVKIDEEALRKYFQIEAGENISFDPKNKIHKVIFTAGFIRGVKYALQNQQSSDMIRKSLGDFQGAPTGVPSPPPTPPKIVSRKEGVQPTREIDYGPQRQRDKYKDW